MGVRVPSGVLLEPLPWQGFLLSAAEFESSCALVGPRLGREVSGPDVIESFDERVDVGGEQVGVAVHGHRDRRVAEVVLDGFGTGVGCGEQTGAGVSEVVNPQALRQFCLFDGLVPDLSSEVAVAQRRTARCGEHERFGIVGNISGEMCGEEVAEESGDGHDATAMVLRWSEVEVTADVGERFGDIMRHVRRRITEREKREKRMERNLSLGR